ncbi:MAG: RMD1 family protein [Flammeovirgaceae bacterium]|nr:RMD1 family protein [Flammeovirgaceae bacterium]MDW8286674.1 RMD1 family protein [Flammeovirgaceae bacterium]
MLKIRAYQIAESFDIKRMRADFSEQPFLASNYELFYVFEGRKYLYAVDYGVIVLAGYDEVATSEAIRFVKHYANLPLQQPITDDLLMETRDDIARPLVQNNRVFLPIDYTETQIRILMLNVGQSVALDYYEELCNNILSNMQVYTNDLEKYGRVNVSKRELMKFIGKTLNVKNSIVDDLYILDDPSVVWDDESLEILNKNLKELFDIIPRFKDLDYRLRIVEENLKLFSDTLNHRESSRLEWIIIILILIEVINVFWHQFFQ